MLVRGMFLVVAMVVSLVLAPFCWATSLVPMIQFGTEADYSGNFYTTISSCSDQYVAADDGGYGVGGYVAAQTVGAHDNLVYDPNKGSGGPGPAFGQATMDVDFRAGSDSDLIGLWFLGSSATDRTYKDWALLQATSGGTENVRFFAGRSMVTNSGGSSQNGGGDNFNTTLALGNWMHLRLSFDNSAATSATATLSVYDSQTLFDASTLKLTDTFTYTAGGFASSEIGVSLLTQAASPAAAFDNFAVYGLGTAPTNLVPEPSALVLLAMGLLGLLAYAWRKRK